MPREAIVAEANQDDKRIAESIQKRHVTQLFSLVVILKTGNQMKNVGCQFLISKIAAPGRSARVFQLK